MHSQLKGEVEFNGNLIVNICIELVQQPQTYLNISNESESSGSSSLIFLALHQFIHQGNIWTNNLIFKLKAELSSSFSSFLIFVLSEMEKATTNDYAHKESKILFSYLKPSLLLLLKLLLLELQDPFTCKQIYVCLTLWIIDFVSKLLNWSMSVTEFLCACVGEGSLSVCQWASCQR